MDLNIERYGKGEKIVFIHGSGLNTNIWHKQRDYLSSFAEVILIDLPGHGNSPGSGCDSVEGYRDAIYNAIRELQLKDCYMVGHSLGGAIALSFAISYPQVLKGLILIATGAKLKVFPQILEGIIKDKEKTLREITNFAFSNKADKKLLDYQYNESLKCPSDVIYKDFFACDNFNVMDTINRISLPTLIICGKDDALTPPKYAEFLQKHIKNSTLVLIEDSGHVPLLEKPDEVNKAIERFIRHANF